jgi:GNAT superfamily N-acetyltransferase
LRFEEDVSHERLLSAGLVAPVKLGGRDERLWLDCDLASLAENRLGDRTDPHALDERRRAEWTVRATSEPVGTLEERSEYERCYWLLEDARRVGTVAVASATWGKRTLRISSLYVFPEARSRGVGGRALDRLRRAIADMGFGVRLETNWSWQRTVHFYVRMGMWVAVWKRELELTWSAERPAPIVVVGEHEATLAVLYGTTPRIVVRARRRGDVLTLDGPARELERDARISDAYWLATSTLSLSLALVGWPLVRSPDKWKDSHFCDAGAPEALAYKISIWEAWDRKHGWQVPTPRIPGLSYPTWDEFEARWTAQREAYEAGLQRNGGKA